LGIASIASDFNSIGDRDTFIGWTADQRASGKLNCTAIGSTIVPTQPAIGAKLQALRIAAANPTSELLVRPDHDITPDNPRSQYSYIPKVASTLELVRQVLERGEQVMIGNTFQNGLDVFGARLKLSITEFISNDFDFCTGVGFNWQLF
jgi:hypothetical protein